MFLHSIFPKQYISAVAWRVAMKFAHKSDTGSILKTYFRKFFLAPKIFRGEKSNFAKRRL